MPRTLEGSFDIIQRFLDLHCRSLSLPTISVCFVAINSLDEIVKSFPCTLEAFSSFQYLEPFRNEGPRREEKRSTHVIARGTPDLLYQFPLSSPPIQDDICSQRPDVIVITRRSCTNHFIPQFPGNLDKIDTGDA